MMRKESWGHLLVYNLLHTAMAQATLGHGVVMRQTDLPPTIFSDPSANEGVSLFSAP